jgi:hypothetical protein
LADIVINFLILSNYSFSIALKLLSVNQNGFRPNVIRPKDVETQQQQQQQHRRNNILLLLPVSVKRPFQRLRLKKLDVQSETLMILIVSNIPTETTLCLQTVYCNQ